MNMNPIVAICRLCLETIWGNNYDAIEDTIKGMLNKLLLKINLNLSKEPLICKKCVMNLKESLNFKSLCLNTKVLSLGANSKNVYEDRKLCRFCMRDTEIEDCTYLYETKESIFVADVIRNHIPELNFNLTREVIICKPCLGALQNLSRFTMKCLDIEDEIRKYTDRSTDLSGQIKLCDMQQLISKRTIRCEANGSNANTFETVYCEGKDVKLKTEIINSEFGDVSDLNVNGIKRYTDSSNDVSGLINLHDTQQLIFKPTIKCEAGYSNTDIFGTVYRKSNDIYLKTNIKNEEFEEVGNLYVKVFKKYIENSNDIIDMYDIQPVSCKPTLISEDGSSDAGASEIVFCVNGDVNLKTEIKNEESEEVGDLDANIKEEEIEIKTEQSEFESVQEPSTATKFDNGSLDISVPKSQSTECVSQREFIYKNSRGTTVYTCKTCPYQAKRRGQLKRHQLIHKSTSDITMFKCDLCSYETKRRDCLNRHNLTHTSELMIKCDLCPYQAKCKEYLKSHKLTHESVSNIKKFKCDMCVFETKRKGTLLQHKLLHKSPLDITMFKCELCPYEAKRRGQLKIHSLKHKSNSDVMMYKCSLCSYEAKRKGDLQKHELIHKSTSELTVFKCDLCPYKTKHKQHLKRHKLSHKSASELKMLKCKLCSYEAKRMDHLKQHKLLHEDSSDMTVLKCDCVLMRESVEISSKNIN